MATSPRSASSPVARNPDNLTQKEFKGKLKQITTDLTQLMKVASAVFALKASDRLQFPNGTTVGRREVKSLQAQLAAEIKSLAVNYREHGKPQKRKRSGKSTGFKGPIIVSQNMVDFLRNANLGPSDPRNPQSPPLNSQLAVTDSGVTTRAILTPLLSIYTKVNNMQRDTENGQFLTSTPQMDQYFGETYRLAAAEPQRYYKSKETGQPDLNRPIPKFDPKHFRYASLQTIVKYNTVPKTSLSAEQQEYLKREDVKNVLANEQALVSNALAVYRDAQEAAKKAAKGK